MEIIVSSLAVPYLRRACSRFACSLAGYTTIATALPFGLPQLGISAKSLCRPLIGSPRRIEGAAGADPGILKGGSRGIFFKNRVGGQFVLKKLLQKKGGGGGSGRRPGPPLICP